jgi:hypothetical protein
MCALIKELDILLIPSRRRRSPVVARPSAADLAANTYDRVALLEDQEGHTRRSSSADYARQSDVRTLCCRCTK